MFPLFHSLVIILFALSFYQRSFENHFCRMEIYKWSLKTSISMCHFMTLVWQLGKTKVFLRAGQMAELDTRRAEVLGNAAKRIQRQVRTYIARKEFISLRKAAIQVQSSWRGNLMISFDVMPLNFVFSFSLNVEYLI